MAHEHAPGHSHAPANYGRAFAIGVALNTGFVVIEALFGILSGSLALVADAGHNLSDVLGLLLAWGASILVRRRPTLRRTYGLRRSSILAALLNAVFLLIAIGAIGWEALVRFAHPEPIAGGPIIGVALVGIMVNGATALLFVSGRRGDLNIRGAYLHMAADAGVSLGVVLAGVAILLTGWQWLDPAVSLVIVVVIFVGTWGLLRDSLDLALDAVPEGIDTAAVGVYLASLPGVREVHDLHIWAMSTTETALTAHLVIPRGGDGDTLLGRASEELHERFGIAHPTIQIERGDPAHPCDLASA
jgi:cobalt-zinc-cadmium efflux system protein